MYVKAGQTLPMKAWVENWRMQNEANNWEALQASGWGMDGGWIYSKEGLTPFSVNGPFDLAHDSTSQACEFW